MISNEIGAPSIDRAAVAKIAVGNGCGFRAGGQSGDDVTPVVADVKHALRGTTENFASVQDGQRRRFGFCRGIAADHAAGTWRQAKSGDQWFRITRPLVGDDAPGNVHGFQRVEQFGNAVEQPRQVAQLAGVDFEKAGRQPGVFAMRGYDAKTDVYKRQISIRSSGLPIRGCIRRSSG